MKPSNDDQSICGFQKPKWGKAMCKFRKKPVNIFCCLMLASFCAGLLGLWTTPVKAAGCSLSGLKLDSEDKKFLNSISDQEKAAGAGQILVAWAPLITFLTDPDATEGAITIADTDWASHAKAIKDIQKIKSCSIYEQVQLRISEVQGARTKFYECLSNQYEKGC